jgi:hypothetical protein
MFKEYHFPYNMITLSGKIITQSAITLPVAGLDFAGIGWLDKFDTI